jgi:hypothetical protein
MAMTKRRLVAMVIGVFGATGLAVAASLGVAASEQSPPRPAVSAQLSLSPTTIVSVASTVPGNGQRTRTTTPSSPVPSGYNEVAVPVNNPEPVIGSATPQPQVASTSSPACTGSQVQASVTSVGPFTGMGTAQDIVTLTSTSTCTISGYPSLQMTSSSGTPLKLSVSDGGTISNVPGPHAVTISTTSVASFLLQYSFRDSTGGVCPSATGLTVTLPNNSTPISVPFSSGMANNQTEFNPCGGAVSVTPFEAGNSAFEY